MSALDLCAGARKFQKYYLFSMGPQKNLYWRGTTHSGISTLKVPFFSQIDQNVPGQPWVDWKSKSIEIIPKQHNSCFYIKPKLLGDFRQLWPSLTPKGTRNLNFDSTIRMGWDYCHCKDYQIPFPMTIHGSKSKLEWLRYLENYENALARFPKP